MFVEQVDIRSMNVGIAAAIALGHHVVEPHNAMNREGRTGRELPVAGVSVELFGHGAHPSRRIVLRVERDRQQVNAHVIDGQVS